MFVHVCACAVTGNSPCMLCLESNDIANDVDGDTCDGLIIDIACKKALVRCYK